MGPPILRFEGSSSRLGLEGSFAVLRMEAKETFLAVGINDVVSSSGDAGGAVAIDDTTEEQTEEGAGDATAGTADKVTEPALVS